MKNDEELMVSSITLMIGLPGSGKSTQAKRIRANNPNVVLTSRDDIREALFGRDLITFTTEQENLVTKVQDATVDSALSANKNVVIHDMNIRRQYRTKWAKVAVKHGVPLKYYDLTSVSVDECVRRDAERYELGGKGVGEDFIRGYAKKYFPWNIPVETPESLTEALKEVPDGHDPYKRVPGLPEAIIVDIDGTVASHEGVRDPYDASRYHLDIPKWEVISIVQDQAYRAIPKKILFVSGRDSKYRDATLDWLFENVKVPVDGLFMRPEGDTRRDDVVKLELFDNHIRGKYNIAFVLDDRDRVVKAWRSIGLTVLQVAEGNF